MRILLADKQDITRAGLMYIINSMENVEYKYIEDKAELFVALNEDQDCVVILDYTIFDINDAAELAIINERFTKTRWIIFSEDLSIDFTKIIIATSTKFSILLKESSMQEITEAIMFAINGNRFICQRMT